MPPFREFVPQGVIPACLLPFHDDLSVDEAEYRRHLLDVAAVPGLAALTINAHASEVAACSLEEQRRVLDLTMEAVGDRLPVVHGVYADGSAPAARIARQAQHGGASSLLVFPSYVLSAGGHLRPEMALAHVKTIAEASDLPLILFQYPAHTGVQYPLDTLLCLAEEVPSVRAIKDWCNDPMLHERHIRVLQGLPRPVHVLTTHSSWLMSSLVLGCKGLLSGAGSVIAGLQVALWNAIQSQDLKTAQALNERIYPLAQAFYAAPFLDMHNRMKEVLVMQGRLSRAVVRPPLVKLGAAELARLREAAQRAGLPLAMAA